jgi:membrane-associated protein
MFNIESIVSGGAISILLIAGIVFAESGLLIGFFLPGDSLLFGAGLAASQGKLSLFWLILTVVIAAIVGDNVGYSIGRRAGPRIFKKQDGILFRQEYLQKSEEFYEKHGGKTIILARFTPIVRTFAPVVAGAGKMSREKFMFYNIIGGVLWGGGITLLGYFIGNRIPHLDRYIEVVIIGVMVISLLLAFGHVLKDAKTRALMIGKIKSGLRKVFLNKKVD